MSLRCYWSEVLLSMSYWKCVDIRGDKFWISWFYHMCNLCECMRVNEEAFQLPADFFFLLQVSWEFVSVLTSYVRICISTTSYMRICIRCSKSHENPYQVMQVTCAASERGMKSMVCVCHFPLWVTCKVASPIDTLSSDYSNLLQLHVKFQYLFSHPVKGWTYAWKALLMMIRGMILICHDCEIFNHCLKHLIYLEL